MNPLAKDIHVDSFLSGASQRYTNPMYVGEKLVTACPVNKISDFYPIYGKEHLRQYDDLRALGTAGKEIDWSVTKQTAYVLQKHALRDKIIWDLKDNADDPIRYDTDSVEVVTDAVKLQLELYLASVFTTTSLYGSNLKNLAAGTNNKWNTDKGDPISDIWDAKEAIRQSIFKYPNTLVISADVYRALKTNPLIKESVKYTSVNGVITQKAIQDLFEIDNMFIAGAGYVTSKEGAATTVTADIWSGDVILAYVDTRPTIKQLTFSYLFRKKGYPMVERWADNEISSDWIRVNDFYINQVSCGGAGYFIYNAI